MELFLTFLCIFFLVSLSCHRPPPPSLCLSDLFLFSRSVASDSLWPHGLQHTRFLCPSLTLRACSNSCPLSQWCRPTISSSVVPFSPCLQSFPASGSFPVSPLFTSHGQSIGASASVLAMNIQVSLIRIIQYWIVQYSVFSYYMF